MYISKPEPFREAGKKSRWSIIFKQPVNIFHEDILPLIEQEKRNLSVRRAMMLKFRMPYGVTVIVGAGITSNGKDM